MDVEVRSIKRRRYSTDSKPAGISVLPPQRLVQNKLIMGALDDSIGKFKISVKLPVIFRNPLTVLRSLSGTEYEPCALALLEYLKKADKSQKFDLFSRHCNDLALIELVEMFQDNYDIVHFLPNWTKEESLADHTVLEAFDLLEEIVKQRISRSALVELIREREVHTLYVKNGNLRKEIDSLRRNIRVLKKQTRWKRIVPTPDVVHAQHEVMRKESQRIHLVNEAMIEGARKIKNLNYEFENKYNMLENGITIAKNEIQKVKKDNEKELIRAREEKNKVLIQLQSIIEKHDRVLAEMFKEKIYLKEELDKQKKEMEIFMKEYRTVEAVYLDLVEQQKKLWQRKADKFFKTRAARIIQRHWRRYAKILREERLELQGKGKNKNTTNIKKKARSTKKRT